MIWILRWFTMSKRKRVRDFPKPEWDGRVLNSDESFRMWGYWVFDSSDTEYLVHDPNWTAK